MAFYLSPIVAVQEVDASTTIAAASTSIAVIVLRNPYTGPEDKRVLITNENQLISTFGQPTNLSYVDLLSASGYLKYGNTLYCTAVRPDDASFAGIVGSPSTTVGLSGSFATLPTSGASVITLADFPSKDPDTFADVFSPSGPMDFIAIHRGAFGNNTRLAVVNAQGYDEVVRQGLHTNWEIYNTLLSVDSPIDVTDTKSFLVLVQNCPYGADTTVESNWINVEAWNVSTDPNAMNDQNRTKFAETVINGQSQYIRIALKESQKNLAVGFTTSEWQAFGGGSDGTTSASLDSQIMDALDLYKNAEEIDVNIFIDSDKSETVKSYINDICKARLDSVGILDVKYELVVNNRGNEVTSMVAWRRGNAPYDSDNCNINSDKVALYGNWLEVYDRWNQRYRWVPASGYVAGIYAYTDGVSETWFAPAGLNRGQLTSVRKLAFNPDQGERDIMYLNGINSLVAFSGQGKVIFGQKNMLDKSSAFNRVNVRRLFNILEKSISTAAKYFLFEPNDPRTRTQLKDMIDPFLRDVQARRGITSFLVVCDETNNTNERVDRNELWCDVLIAPTHAAEFIILRFTATKTGANFQELVQGT